MNQIHQPCFPLTLAKSLEILRVEKIEGPVEVQTLIKELGFQENDLLQILEKKSDQLLIVAVQGKKVELSFKIARSIFVNPQKNKIESKACQFCLQQGTCHDRRC